MAAAVEDKLLHEGSRKAARIVVEATAIILPGLFALYFEIENEGYTRHVSVL